ncbi:O-antigen ligase family protein [Solirubrobacter ginsenosidimutans]|uniref:O-antigen ligase family protein n=1 Tax=Solirubrobacter ginsenosidimutans TaxID=490573 RepID=A0A9X3S6D2_9ACTN|nr:O-antigen ligase family protein [Solirubrobacter ginsenosidimutans]MDA0166592.1 O-antigen ligase family protein [Solirubrobacter ginsenosidimutans]
MSAVVALVLAIWSVASISLLPPKLTPRAMTVGGATTHVLLDSRGSWILDPTSTTADFTGLSMRADLLGDIIATPPMRDRIAHIIGVPASQISSNSRITANVTAIMREPDLEQRSNQILNSKQPYRLEMQADPALPILNIYAQGPSTAAAMRLANAAYTALEQQLHELTVRDGASESDRVQIRQLGGARGGVINGGSEMQIAILTFLVSFVICGFLLLLGRRARQGWKEAADAASGGGAPKRRAVRTLPAAGGMWPHTTRVLPWMIAGFMAVLWLTPFNTIQLTASLPFDLKLDRLVLPVIIATWALAMAVGGPSAPRFKPTWIHAAIVSFIGAACIGVLLNARALNQSLEFDLSSKKILLLVFYGCLFMMVASIVRKQEVPAFLKYTLGLAVICALGTIWEYRFHYNVFYDLSDKLLPGIFQVGSAESTGVDDLGRRLTRGPGEHPLETVAMLSMAIPIALVGMLGSQTRRQRLLYGLAACIMLAAGISTYRKSALLAPLSVILTIAYFRRRELLKLAPLGLVGIVVVRILSPGALGSILFQLHANRLDVGTVSDRSSDYDAVRPDVWTHLAFGRGYGSYDHVSYRILDSEMLGRLVDTGIVGLLFYALMVVSIVLAARGVIRRRDPVWSPPALAVAASAVAFLVVSFLFDVTSFPHTPYIILSLAGLLAAIISGDASADAPRITPTTTAVRRRQASRQHPRKPRPAAAKQLPLRR